MKDYLRFATEIEEMLDEASDTLSVEGFDKLLDNIEDSVENHR